MSKLRLGVKLPNMKDSTSFYRGAAPLGFLHHQIPGIELILVSEYNWATVGCFMDAIFVQRPYREEDLTVIKMAKDLGVKVWVDYDDDLFSVPKSNPAFHVYGSAATQRRIAECIVWADAVTVSTEQLKRRFQEGESLNRNIHVVPNALNDYLLVDTDSARLKRTVPQKNRNPLMFWRGSKTHQKDIAEYMVEMIEGATMNPNWTFTFLGDEPWFFSEKMPKNVMFEAGLDIVEYFTVINKVKPQGMMVPLHDDVFNRAKSNIAWIEGVYAGALALAPSWEEWKRPGCLNYDDGKQFKDLLNGITKGEFNVNDAVNDAWTYIMDNLRLSRVNDLRAKVLAEILG